MNSVFARISSLIDKLSAGPLALPKATLIAANRCFPAGVCGAALPDNRCYLTVTVNELFLALPRKWFIEYQPMVVFATTLIRGGETITVPSIVGPSLLSSLGRKLPQGLLLDNIDVAGPLPYRGGAITLSVLLYRVRRSDHARDLLDLVESISKAVGTPSDFMLMTKIGDSLLEGFERILGLGDTEAVMGQRLTLSPVGPESVRTLFGVLVGGESDTPLDQLSVEQGRLKVGASPHSAPFTGGDYVLYSLAAQSRRTDESTLPFYPLYTRAKKTAFRGGEENWKAAKATFSEVWQQMMDSPDLTAEQALELFGVWKQDLLAEKQRGDDFGRLTIRADRSPANAQTRTAAAILDM